MVPDTPVPLRMIKDTMWLRCALPPTQNQHIKESRKVTIKDKQPKWEACSRLGVLVCFHLKDGHVWAKRYMVCDMGALMNANLKAGVELFTIQRSKAARCAENPDPARI